MRIIFVKTLGLAYLPTKGQILEIQNPIKWSPFNDVQNTLNTFLKREYSLEIHNTKSTDSKNATASFNRWINSEYFDHFFQCSLQTLQPRDLIVRCNMQCGGWEPHPFIFKTWGFVVSFVFKCNFIDAQIRGQTDYIIWNVRALFFYLILLWLKGTSICSKEVNIFEREAPCLYTFWLFQFNHVLGTGREIYCDTFQSTFSPHFK